METLYWMLGEFASIKSKHDGGVAEANQKNLLNVIANEVKQSFLHCHCEPKARQSFQLHNNRLPRRYAPRNDDNAYHGHSMLWTLIRLFFDVILDFWRKPIRRASRIKMQIFKAELKSWMLGEFAPLKSKHDGGVAEANQPNLLNVIANKVKQSFLHCHCEPKARQSFQQHNNRLPRRFAPCNDGNTCGRSMIEMLGVLAIIGVLSVAGIAGYSKAMLMWRSYIQKNMLTQIITTMIKIKPNLNHSSKSFDNITYLLDAMGEVPEGTLYNNGYIYDKDGNRVDILYGLQTIKYKDGHQNQSFIYVARFRFISNGNSLTPSAETYCKNLIEATQPIANEIQRIYFIQANSKSELGESGKTLFSRADLQKATLNDIHQKCKMVLDEGGNARFSLYLNPY